ncbi:MAG: hypothetical protein ACK6AO_05570 [Planctomycetota bacterium]
MKIRLRVAGIYFNRTIEVPANTDGTPITIKDAMHYCVTTFPIDKPNGFFYKGTSMPLRSGGSIALIESISHNFSGQYDFNGDGKITAGKDNKGLTLGANSRPAGLYHLKSMEVQKDPEVRLIWQYYVRENDGRGDLRSRTRPGENFTGYDQFQLKDHDEVIWRLVAIQFEPMNVGEQAGSNFALRSARY